MLPVDTGLFWRENEISLRDNCFYRGKYAAMGLRMSGECVFAELGEEGDPFLVGRLPNERKADLFRRYNDRAEEIVGRRLLPETFPDPSLDLPKVNGLADIFECRSYISGGSVWLESDCNTTDRLEALLERVEQKRKNLYDHVFPANWQEEKKRLFELTGKLPQMNRGIRGPVTFGTSLYGVENLLMLYYDGYELFVRLSQAISDVLFELTMLYDSEAGFTPETRPAGYGFADDNCCLMTPEMYRDFGFPILKRMFEEFSPNPGDRRHQHSDSAMGHLLPILGELDLTSVNFGPTLTVAEIREHCKTACIHGQIAPFTLMRNDEEGIIREVTQAIKEAEESRGLCVTTAGSVNNGSLLTSMRAVMYAIQNNPYD